MKKSVITSQNIHLSLDTQELSYQTHYTDHNQADTRPLHLSNTPIAIITLKLHKQGKACSLSATFHFLQALLPKSVPTPSIPHMQANQKQKHDL